MQIIEYLKEIKIITKSHFMYVREIIMFRRLFHPLGVQQDLQYHNEHQIIPIQGVNQEVIQEEIHEVIHDQLVNMVKHLNDGVVKGLFVYFFFFLETIFFIHFFFYRKDRYENYRIKPASYPRERDHRDRERRLDKRR